MAEGKRRNGDPVDGDPNETTDLGGKLDQTSDASSGKLGKASDTSDKSSAKSEKSTEKRGNPFVRLGRFVREVVAELRKVIWPSRKELLTYTAVVVVFVTAMLTIVGTLDFAFAKAVLWVFGSSPQ